MSGFHYCYFFMFKGKNETVDEVAILDETEIFYKHKFTFFKCFLNVFLHYLLQTFHEEEMLTMIMKDHKL